MRVFLGKSLLMGIIGGTIGSLLGTLLGVVWTSIELPSATSAALPSVPLLLAGLLLAPVALAAGLIPRRNGREPGAGGHVERAMIGGRYAWAARWRMTGRKDKRGAGVAKSVLNYGAPDARTCVLTDAPGTRPWSYSPRDLKKEGAFSWSPTTSGISEHSHRSSHIRYGSFLER